MIILLCGTSLFLLLCVFIIHRASGTAHRMMVVGVLTTRVIWQLHGLPIQEDFLIYVEFSRPRSPKHYEYACEILHKLSKSKSLSPAQNYLVLTMPLGRSYTFPSFLCVHRDAYSYHMRSRCCGPVAGISFCCFSFHSGPVGCFLVPFGCFHVRIVLMMILIFQQ